jgi:hypothetical protein
MPIILLRKQRSGGSWFKASPAKYFLRPPLSGKYSTQKRAGGVAHVVEHLTSKCEALSSNSNTTKTNKQKFG